MRFAGRAVLVTGAASGIGRATAAAFAAEGARVAATDINAAGIDALAAEHGSVEAFAADLTDPAEVEALGAAVVERLGAPWACVNCAGWDRIEPFLDGDLAYWDTIVKLNFLGPITLARSVLPAMIDAGGGGRVVLVGSDAGRVGSMGESVYSGAKGGVIGFTKSLAREMARHGITANCVCPGPTDTPLFHSQPEKMQEALIRAIPFRRLAEPADVANAILFFADERSGYITGQTISVSGGLTMHG